MSEKQWSTTNYAAQRESWPRKGRHILAQFDDETIVVYQAYRPSIGEAAVRDQRLGGGGFSFDRMSWIKPNFLWMMYRSGWGTKPGQEVTLALRITRGFFNQLLEDCVFSTFQEHLYESRDEWSQHVKRSHVRLQWDPDHDPRGNRVERRALQLGLRRGALRQLAATELVSVTDVSEFVESQRPAASSRDWESLKVPRESVYPVEASAVRGRLGLDAAPVPPVKP